MLQPLTRNYRSTGRILRVAGQAIRHNEKPTSIPEYPLQAEREDGGKVRIVTHPTAQAEAQWIASEIARLHAAGAKWRSFAVLYRIHAHRDKMVAELKERKIPFVIKNLSILSQRLVRDIVAYLRLIEQPADNVACARVLAMPAWRLDPSDLVRLSQRAAKSRRASLWDELQTAQAEPPFCEGERRLGDLIELIAEMRKSARRLPVAELFDVLADRLEIALTIAPEEKK
jgi:superfamily I DNA/RNA helicase